MKNLKELELYNDSVPPEKQGLLFNRAFFVKPEISPYLIYRILKDTFGEANGNDEIDEEKTQWRWTFKYKDFYIEIYDWRLLTNSIGIYHASSNKSESEKLGHSILTLLTKSAEQKKGTLKSISKTSKHRILENPFITYYSTANNLLSVASQFDSLTDVAIASDIEIELWDKKSDLYRSAFLMLLSSFEGFLNILYELYIKVDLRNDRIYERISRQDIDIKLRLAPVYCDGFKTKTITHEDNRFKRYLKLVNLRNDFVHANLNKSNEQYVFTEDNHTFIIENEDKWEIPSNINKLQHEHIEVTKEIIDDLTELVFESMETKTRREFQGLIYYSEIEVEDIEGVLIPR